MIFVTGTDTNIGKTLVCSWLCLHTGFGYFKPIQTGLIEGRDSDTVHRLANTRIYPEAYVFNAPVSPHLAATHEQKRIDLELIQLPSSAPMFIEGAGGVAVPVNEKDLMFDVMRHFNRPILLVSAARLGTINHTLLSIEALRLRGLRLLGVVMTGDDALENKEAVEYYGKTTVLAILPCLQEVSTASLKSVPLPESFKQILFKEACL